MRFAPQAPMLGILVHGDNHFVVRGPFPDRVAALALVRHWSVIEIGKKTPPELERWRISTREFRENLEWAVIVPGSLPGNVPGSVPGSVPGEPAPSPAVAVLLEELSARGVRIYNANLEAW